jgi:hypothetical protein
MYTTSRLEETRVCCGNGAELVTWLFRKSGDLGYGACPRMNGSRWRLNRSYSARPVTCTEPLRIVRFSNKPVAFFLAMQQTQTFNICV